jgi:hypothetical protein
MTSIQIFVYATGGIVDSNRFPLLWFDDDDAKHRFISNLVSRPMNTFSNEFFILNNPQLLPANVREKHTYQGFDGCFSINENTKIGGC